MTKILVVGDTHGNDNFFGLACQIGHERGATKLFQVGDFGYWAHYKAGVDYLDAVEAYLREYDLEGYFLDGNHENHPLLWELYGPGGVDYNPDDEGFWKVRENLRYAWRGHRWEWDGIKFLSLGGAYSVDKPFRHEGTTWWPEETITNEQAGLAADGGYADVMFTHDAPEGADIPCLRHQRSLKRDVFPESTQQRVLLRWVVDQVKPKMLIHGHYHDHYEDDIGDTHVIGLGADMSPLNEAIVMFDTDVFHEIYGQDG